MLGCILALSSLMAVQEQKEAEIERLIAKFQAGSLDECIDAEDELVRVGLNSSPPLRMTAGCGYALCVRRSRLMKSM